MGILLARQRLPVLHLNSGKLKASRFTRPSKKLIATAESLITFGPCSRDASCHLSLSYPLLSAFLFYYNSTLLLLQLNHFQLLSLSLPYFFLVWLSPGRQEISKKSYGKECKSKVEEPTLLSSKDNGKRSF